MADQVSEFGGRGVQRSGVFPPPHIPTAAEQLSLIYRTGDPSGMTEPDNGEIFAGLRTEEAQRAARIAEGVYETVGVVAEALEAEAASAIAALQAEAAPE